MAAQRTKEKNRTKQLKKLDKQLQVIAKEIKNFNAHIQELTATIVKGNYRIL